MKDYEIEAKKTELESDYIKIGSAIVMVAAFAIGIPIFSYRSCTNETNYINWDSIKKSSIVITQDRKITNYHIISKNEDNIYHDIINNYDINPDTIVYNIDTTSYLANINNVKGIYSKEELSVILKDFSMNQEYTVSDQTAKVLVKQK